MTVTLDEIFTYLATYEDEVGVLRDDSDEAYTVWLEGLRDTCES